jgi:hypothetical protein
VKRVLRRAGIGGVVLAILGALVAYHLHSSTDARLQLLAFREAIERVETKDEIERVFHAGQFERLQLLKENPEQWVVATPLDFGASNWYLYLEFMDRRLAKVKIRLADSSEIHPRDAPGDIVRE